VIDAPTTRADTPRWLDADARARLGRRLEEALHRARRSGAQTIASVTACLDHTPDPTAVVAGSRLGEEPWVCLEQPDRHGSALAGLGVAWAIESRGSERFASAAEQWRATVVRAAADPAQGPPGAGLVALGGFAFAPESAAAPQWRGYPPLSLTVPEISLVRRDSEVWLTVNIRAAADDTLEALERRVDERLSNLECKPIPLLDPAPIGPYEVLSTMPPSHFEDAVARAVDRIRSGELVKIVLAREVQVHAPRDHDPAAVLGLLREEFRSCYVFAVGRGDATFVAASPELLVRREGQRASTVALAGSARRSADPAVDDHLGERLLRSEKDLEENAIVARRIARALTPHSVWVTAAEQPALVRVANIQHLARPIRAQLADNPGVIELAGVLHPTPAVGAEPVTAAWRLIPALEGMDRGWYTGAVGWTDAAGDGEFCVALRCGLLRGPVAWCYAGCGIVRDSDPAAELAESEVKLEAILPALAG